MGFLPLCSEPSGSGFGGEWTGYLIINRQYFGDGPMGTVYGWQTTGALMGHFIATSLAGLIMFTTDSYMAILGPLHGL